MIHSCSTEIYQPPEIFSGRERNMSTASNMDRRAVLKNALTAINEMQNKLDALEPVEGTHRHYWYGMPVSRCG